MSNGAERAPECLRPLRIQGRSFIFTKSADSKLSPFTIPDLVMAELGARGLGSRNLFAAGVEYTVAVVDPDEWEEILRGVDPPGIQPADAQVFVLVRASQFQALAITDDLALRRLLEEQGATAVGSIGILVRAYTSGKLSRKELDESVDALIRESTLHLSRSFRLRLRQILADLA